MYFDQIAASEPLTSLFTVAIDSRPRRSDASPSASIAV